MRKMDNFKILTKIRFFIYLILILLIAGLTACKHEQGGLTACKQQEQGGTIEIVNNFSNPHYFRITNVDDSVLYETVIPVNSKESYKVHIDGYYKIYYAGFVYTPPRYSLLKSVYMNGGKTVMVTPNYSIRKNNHDSK